MSLSELQNKQLNFSFYILQSNINIAVAWKNSISNRIMLTAEDKLPSDEQRGYILFETNPNKYFNVKLSVFPAEAHVLDFLLRSQSDITNSSHGMWLQQTCTLFVQSGVQLLDEFTQGAAAWADTNVVRANFSQPSHAQSQPERATNNPGNSHLEI